jgi:hypothetical protein
MVPKASFVLVVAVTVAVLVPISIALAGLGPKTTEGFYNNAPISIADARGDVKPVSQRTDGEVGPVPVVKDYHDIIGASVQKRGEVFFFSIYLAGNPNKNENYETMYRWHIITTNQITGGEQQYRILMPNFHTGNSTRDGWYFGVYDVTAGTFKMPMRKIFDMPENRVEFPVEDFYIGNPSSFRFWVEVAVRSNSTTSGPPDYLMDYAPK